MLSTARLALLRRVPMRAAASRSYLTQKAPPKWVTAEEAVAVVKSGDKIYCHGMAAFPTKLTDALAKRAPELTDVEFLHLHIERDNACAAPELAASFYTSNFFVGHNQRDHLAAGRASYIPTFLSEVPSVLRRRIIPLKIAFLNLSPPDAHGFCSFGSEVAVAFPAAESAEIVIAQINPHIPRTLGHPHIHINAIDYAVKVDEPLPYKKVAEVIPGSVEDRIGKVVANLIPDGACLQMGIGGIPDAVLTHLKNHKNLGVHTEMFSDGLIPLIKSGAVTNLNKTFLPGRTVTSFISGSKQVYDFVNDNPDVAFLDASITNSPVVIATNSRVTAINGAVEVDLTGQVCADSIGTRIISGVGGQVDFERGAALSSGGIPIIVLPSRTKNNKPRIVPTLNIGAGVTTSRYHVHIVATEYGAAELFGLSTWQRAQALISIAHPDDRAMLEAVASKTLGRKIVSQAFPPASPAIVGGRLVGATPKASPERDPITGLTPKA